MHSSSLINQIRNLKPQMSPAVARIADVVCTKPQKVMSYTVNDLAQAADTSISSVVRFCREIGFDSLAEFRLALTQEVAFKQQQNSNINDDTIFAALVEQLKSTVDITIDTIDERLIHQTVSAVALANRIICFGVGASAVTANFLHNRLMRLGINVSMPTDHHAAHIKIYGCKKGDVLIVFSASGSTLDIIDCARYARQQGLTVIGITNQSKAALHQYCDYAIAVGVPEDLITSGGLHTKLGSMMFGELLIQLLIEQNPEFKKAYSYTALAVVDKTLK